MAEKREVTRFTLRFNNNDPDQVTVSKLLKQQGRRKTHFITSAILHYVRYKDSVEPPVQQSMDREALENLILEILEKYHVVYSEGNQTEISRTENEKQGEGQEQPQTESENIPDDLEKIFGKQGILSIANTLSAFQNG